MRVQTKLLAAVIVGLMALTGCSTTNSTLFANAYTSKADGAYRLPTIPVSKVPREFRRQTVEYTGKEKVGTIIDVYKRQAKTARATGLATIDEQELLARFEAEIISSNSYTFEKQSGRLTCRAVRKLGAITLSHAPMPLKPGTGAEAALVDAVKQHGLRILPWSKATIALRGRLSWLHKALGAPWPDMSDAKLLASLSEWLAPFLAGQTDFKSLAEGGLKDALLSGVPSQLRYDLDRLAPSHFTVPTGSSIPLTYGPDGEAPVLSVRVQELFGLKTHPSIGDGKIPLIVEMLSPAQRPIQLTQDLPSFWQGSWSDVRADMRGRYPRHEWPENPSEAAPTRRAKQRK